MARHKHRILRWFTRPSAPPLQRHPFEVMIFAVALLQGTTFVFGRVPPSVAAINLEPAVLVLWGFCLMFAGAMGIASAAWRDIDTAVLLERIAVGTLGVAAPCYALAILSSTGLDGLAASYTPMMTVPFAFWRMAQIQAVFRQSAAAADHS